MPELTCPVCGGALHREERSLRCGAGHCYDVARQGYVNLLRTNRSKDKRHGDDKRMVAARTAFLDAGYYAPLRDAIAAAATEYTTGDAGVLDAGCGEGYYTAHVLHTLRAQGASPSVCGVDISRDPAAMNRLTEAAEAAKRELSSVSTTTVNLPFLASDGGQPLHFETQVTRDEFERLTADLVERTMGPCKRALADAHMGPGDIGKVLMVGGSSRIPAVKRAVRELTGKEPSESINPDESVALGACLQAGVLAGDVGGLLLLDVTPHSLGIEVVGDVMSVLIPRNSTLPTTKSDIYTTVSPMQTTVEINVLQGESPKASENTSLGKFMLGGLRLGMKKPQVEVTFEIDANGIVHVTARDLETNKAANISIEGSSNMSQRQIEAATKRLTDGR